MPAFRAGVESFVRFNAQRARLLRSVDDLGRSLLAMDRTGSVVHQTPTLDTTLASDPQRDVILSAMHAQAASVFARTVLTEAVASLTISTDAARYRVMSSMLPGGRAHAADIVLVALDRLTPARPSVAVLHAAFNLTASVSHVALLLSDGRSNEDVARQLGISPHTARRHTERVLQKLAVRSRAEVSGKVYSSS